MTVRASLGVSNWQVSTLVSVEAVQQDQGMAAVNNGAYDPIG